MLPATDTSASLLAIANALDAKGMLAKQELATAAQERLLVLQEELMGGMRLTGLLSCGIATLGLPTIQD
jgi:hypothetical protein